MASVWLCKIHHMNVCLYIEKCVLLHPLVCCLLCKHTTHTTYTLLLLARHQNNQGLTNNQLVVLPAN